MLDATISGTSEMCAVKDTIFMVGGKEETFKACEPIFAAIAREWIYMGENGKGAVVKTDRQSGVVTEPYGACRRV